MCSKTSPVTGIRTDSNKNASAASILENCDPVYLDSHMEFRAPRTQCWRLSRTMLLASASCRRSQASWQLEAQNQ